MVTYWYDDNIKLNGGCSTAQKIDPDPAPVKEEQKVDKEEKEAVQDKKEKIDLKGRTITFGAWSDITPDESMGKDEKLVKRKKEFAEKLTIDQYGIMDTQDDLIVQLIYLNRR